MKVNAIVLAAGSGSRMKSKTKKQFMTIKGQTSDMVCFKCFSEEHGR